MMKPDRDDDAALELMFRHARQAPPPVPAGLMARVLDDALAQPAKRQMPGWRWLRPIGGISGLAGLVSAACTGFWIGVAPPDLFPDLAGQVVMALESDTAETAPAGFDAVNWELDGS